LDAEQALDKSRDIVFLQLDFADNRANQRVDKLEQHSRQGVSQLHMKLHNHTYQGSEDVEYANMKYTHPEVS